MNPLRLMVLTWVVSLESSSRLPVLRENAGPVEGTRSLSGSFRYQGDRETGKALLREYVYETIGFQELEGRRTFPAKSLMRKLGPLGGEPFEHPKAFISHISHSPER